MSRNLFYKRGNKWYGVFPPAGGFQKGRRGIRRSLCSVTDLNGMDREQIKSYLFDLYQKKLHEINSAELINKQKSIEKEKKQKELTVRQVGKTWLESLRQRGRAQRTLNQYGRTLALYETACGNHKIKELNRGFVDRFISYLLTKASYRGLAINKTSAHTHIRQFKTFSNFCADRKLTDPSLKIKNIEKQQTEMLTLTLDDLRKVKLFVLEQIEQAVKNGDKKKERDYRNMNRLFFMATNLVFRRGVLWSLMLKNIDLDNRVIYVRSNPELGWLNKKLKNPNKPINQTLYKFLENDLKGRPSHERYFLDNGAGRPWYAHPNNMTGFVRKVFDAVGLPKEVKPLHWGIRATVITEMLLSEGADMFAVQQLADHDSIETTMLYLDRRKVAQKKAVDIIEKLGLE